MNCPLGCTSGIFVRRFLALINTPLQRGACGCVVIVNRFNGFPQARGWPGKIPDAHPTWFLADWRFVILTPLQTYHLSPVARNGE